MTSSQHATLSPSPDQPLPEKKTYVKRWLTPTVIIVTIATVLNMLGMVMILGSMQQIYRQMNTLTDFTGNCILNDYTGKTTPPVTEPPPAPVVATPKTPSKPAPTPAPAPTPKPSNASVNNRLFDIGDIVDKK